ncbi:hypothetical protein F4677DRAFT_119973 [Hypoxylon crocopeplum]|nr:hypothetical protein F4677DRAFT_119973 [Hypoxylon crocopeplum]
MSSSPPPGENPPPYITGNPGNPEEVVQPVILVLAGQFIRAQTSDGPPLYELSRDVSRASISEAHLAQVSLERLIHNVRVNANGTPRVKQHNRHIFELKHLPPVISTGFPYCLDAMSRSAVGNLALKTTSFPRSGFKVVKIKPEKEDGFPKGYRARKESLKEVEDIFDVRKRRGHYEWVRTGEQRIAIEDKTGDEHKLILISAVTRRTMDALIGSWCLRIWHDSIKSHHGPRLGFQSEVRSAREVLPRWW